jgi:cation diffusion facilitator CzcD-associated flavoprotein CzcO
MRTQTPRGLYCYNDFPMPSTYPEWPPGEQVYQHLLSYAEQFGLIRHVSLNTEVRHLSRFKTGVGWQLHYPGAASRISTASSSAADSSVALYF